MSLKETIKKSPDGIIAKAYAFAEKAHTGHKRESGEPYFNHIRATAEVLVAWHLDEATIAAGLLHDVVEDTGVPLEEITKNFGEEIAFLVDGVTKLGHIKYRGAQTKIENLRKMILAISQDLRVVFIKLADRLHNMKTLAHLPPAKQKRIAEETSEIYAPLAYRLGMQFLSGELQDLAFPYLYPKENKWLKDTVADEYDARRKYLQKLEPLLKRELQKQDLKPLAIDFRAKRYSSLYHKLLRHAMDMGKVYDVVAMRIIMETVSDCYAALGIIHQLWPPLPGRIKDYIAMPKPNGYQSLHTTIIGPNERIVEVQIRTQKMHEENENGIAAHWMYEQKKTAKKESGEPHQKIKDEVKWVEQLRNWVTATLGRGKVDAASDEFIKSMKIDFFKDRIYVITPQGDVIDLPAGATPVDFAYQIHTDVGNACVGAKVNDHIVPLNHKLQSGNMVQILTQKNKHPSEDWLTFVKTAMARDHIKLALRQKGRSLRAASSPTKTELKIVADDRIGLIKDISGITARSHVSILNVHSAESPGKRFHIVKIQCATTDKHKIEKLILKIRAVKGVREVGYQML